MPVIKKTARILLARILVKQQRFLADSVMASFLESDV